MKRLRIKDLNQWKNKKNRLPLILQGARQVGKTHLLKHFGETSFQHCHHFDFERQAEQLIPLFEKSIEPSILLQNLSLLSGRQIDVVHDLVIFDEIQNCPRAITSLKYFCEDLQELSICAAGSLLGLTLSSDSFPVGKVEYLDLFPMSFEEFLNNHDHKLLMDVYDSVNHVSDTIPQVAHDQLWELLLDYYVTGGMPAVVHSFLECRNAKFDGYVAARKVQENLLRDYMSDINKHSGGNNAIHIASIFGNIPMQLSMTTDGSTNRYKFKDVLPRKKGYSEFEGPISWLEKAGLIYKVLINNHSELPLKSFCKSNLFKLYYFDHGLLAASLGLAPEVLVLQNYGISKGYFAENFVAHELMASGAQQLFCWEEKKSEIEFIQEIKGFPVPIEVKSGQRTQAKSLKQYRSMYSPDVSVKISAKPLSFQDGILNIPLYLSGKTLKLCHNIP